MENKYKTIIENAFSGEQEEIVKWIQSDISVDTICSIISILSELNEVSICKTVMKIYDELWLNPAFLLIDNWSNNITRRSNKAYIYYRADSDDILSKRCIELTDKNLHAFKNARTAQDIKQIEETS